MSCVGGRRSRRISRAESSSTRVTADEFEVVLKRRNHTLKRALTDPRLISGIGNAYSDEILHRARLSPVALTSRLTSEESARLFAAARDVLGVWLQRLRGKARGEFPSKVTAFHEEMAVHGRFGLPCPDLSNESAAHPLRRQRNQLLSALPDQRSLARRPLVVAAAEKGLAQIDRRAGANASVSGRQRGVATRHRSRRHGRVLRGRRATGRSAVTRPTAARGLRQCAGRRADRELRGSRVGRR